VRIIPAIDVMGGVVVRGVGGRREEYRPIVSKLTSSTDPVKVARALVNAFKPRELYLADLDAIGGSMPAFKVYPAILEMGVSLWVDAGIRDINGATVLAACGCDVVAGLETIPSADVLCDIVEAVGAERVVFSLDMRDGVPLRDWSIPDRNPVPTAVALGITRLIVLDLARVGGGFGAGTEELCHNVASTYPHVEVFAGGGIAGPEDLQRLAACGVRGALVASALHDGRICV
jgi:phosphoribosylformimino-5-aminoimidazole carboxamide ribotide isomerase